jgi:uncharacterized protein
MLLSYSFQNFYSFAEKTQVSFLLNQRDAPDGWVARTPSGKRVSTVMAVLGANAAGKTTLVKFGPFLADFIANSFALQPGQPLGFMTHMTRMSDPSAFEVVVEDGAGTEWTYTLIAHANQIEHESLFQRPNVAGTRKSRVFIRQRDGDGYDVKQEFGLADSEAAKVRPNVSLISWAKQYGSEVAQRIAQLSVASNIDQRGQSQADAQALWKAAEFFQNNESHAASMRSLLKSWDFGLDDVVINAYDTVVPNGTEKTKAFYPLGLHKAGESNFALPFSRESSGTQRAFLLLWKLLPILEKGGVAFMDELEGDLHPHMLEPLLRIFHSPITNPHAAQIIFTCHNPEVLRVLHRTQVTFVEKHHCMSDAYRGDEIEGLTNQANLQGKYLSGALGAVPQL